MIKNIVRSIMLTLLEVLAVIVLRCREHWDTVVGKLILKTVGKKGENVEIYGMGKIIDSDNLDIGSHVRIGKSFYFHCKGGIVIGKNTQMSRNVTIYTANHDISGNAIPYDEKYINKGVKIGESVWIGMNVCITPGVTIGDGAVIGMGAVVSKHVPDGAIVVGASQRVIRYRDMSRFRELDAQGKYFGVYSLKNKVKLKGLQ